MDDTITLDRVTYAYPAGPPVLCDLNWRVHEGESWAVVGPVGAGKSTLAELLLGRLRPTAGTIAWPFIDRLRAAGRPIAWPADAIEYVAFREDSRLFTYARHYYQQRFNFIDPLDDLTLDQFLRSGRATTDDAIRTTATKLGVEHLRTLSLIKLSNGQMRRARIARALLSRPELLILDDPFLGLDIAGRTEVAHLLGALVRSGQRLILITSADLLPDWVTNVLELPSLSRPAITCSPAPNSFAIAPDPTGELDSLGDAPVIDLRHVSVAYGGRPILTDVSWTVRRGERWAVLGPNGSGKSTLLSLLCGDHPQAYCNDVRLFGRRRGTGESIWDIKARVGLASPELHLYFHEPLSAAETAATGFFDVVAFRPTTPEQDQRVRELFDQLALANLADRPFARLSTGEQRLVLLIRALVKRPELLILDEPFQGLDSTLATHLRDWLDAHLGPGQTLLFVTHHAIEIPRSMTHKLRLDEGRIVD